MKLMEAIIAADDLIPNAYGIEEKIRWLSELDGKIKKEIIDTHEGYDLIPFDGYTTETDRETQLLADPPYDGMYLDYLQMKIDYYNGETSRYENSSAAFEAAYSDFNRYYNRTARPIRHKRRYW